MGVRGKKPQISHMVWQTGSANGQLSPPLPASGPTQLADERDKGRLQNLYSRRDSSKPQGRETSSLCWSQQGQRRFQRMQCLNPLLEKKQVLSPVSLWTGIRVVTQGRDLGCRTHGPFRQAGSGAQRASAHLKPVFP